MSLLLAGINSISIDCPNLINIARNLQMQSTQATIWTALNNDCCSAASITCTNQRVTRIDWNRMGLIGNISDISLPSEITFLRFDHNSLSGTIQNVFTTNLTSIDLSGNRLTGTIPVVLPKGMQFLYLGSNLFTGNIPMTLPNGLLHLSVDTNLLTGDVPPFPSSLRYLALGYPGWGGNYLTGTVQINKPQLLYILKNWITDVVIQDTSVLTQCDLSNNPLLGNLNIAALTMCTTNGLYNASLLPNTKTTTTLVQSAAKPIILSMEEILSPTRVPTATKYFSTLESFNNLYTTTITTITFQIQIAELSITLSKLIRFTLSAVFLLILIRKTPFVREFNNKFKIGIRREERSGF